MLLKTTEKALVRKGQIWQKRADVTDLNTA